MLNHRQPSTLHVSSSHQRRLGLDISWDVSVEDGWWECSRRERLAAHAPALIRRCHRSSATVQPFSFTFSQRRVGPASCRLVSSLATKPSLRPTRPSRPPRAAVQGGPGCCRRRAPTLTNQLRGFVGPSGWRRCTTDLGAPEYPLCRTEEQARAHARNVTSESAVASGLE